MVSVGDGQALTDFREIGVATGPFDGHCLGAVNRHARAGGGGSCQTSSVNPCLQHLRCSHGQTARLKTQRLDGWSDLQFESSTFGPKDVAFGVTVWHYTKSTIEGLRLAHESGATTVMLTDISYSPGADFAGILPLFAPPAIGEYLGPRRGRYGGRPHGGGTRGLRAGARQEVDGGPA